MPAPAPPPPPPRNISDFEENFDDDLPPPSDFEDDNTIGPPPSDLESEFPSDEDFDGPPDSQDEEFPPEDDEPPLPDELPSDFDDMSMPPPSDEDFDEDEDEEDDEFPPEDEEDDLPDDITLPSNTSSLPPPSDEEFEDDEIFPPSDEEPPFDDDISALQTLDSSKAPSTIKAPIKSKSSNASTSSKGNDIDLSFLDSGLDLKGPPKIIRNSSMANTGNDSSNNNNKNNQNSSSKPLNINDELKKKLEKTQPVPPSNIMSELRKSIASKVIDEENSNSNTNSNSTSVRSSFSEPPSPPKQTIEEEKEQEQAQQKIKEETIATKPEKKVEKKELTIEEQRKAHINLTGNKSIQEIAKELTFTVVEGKFEGDPFERLLMKSDKFSKCIYVLTENCAREILGRSQATGKPAIIYWRHGDASVGALSDMGIEPEGRMEFDLEKDAYVYEDVTDPQLLILDFSSKIIIFKFNSTDDVIKIMKNLPEEVFLSPESKENEKKELEAQQAAAAAANEKNKGSGPKIQHIKGTSVEDILECDFDTIEEHTEKLNTMFEGSNESNLPADLILENIPLPSKRKDLLSNQNNTLKLSLKRLKLLLSWINNDLKIWHNKLTIKNYSKEFSNGILLIKLLTEILPNSKFHLINKKVLTINSAISNIENCLGELLRSKTSLNLNYIPKANEILNCFSKKNFVFINELFNLYIVKSLYKKKNMILSWYNNILKQYSRGFSTMFYRDSTSLTPSNDTGLFNENIVWKNFQSGVSLFCILYHFYGACGIKLNEDSSYGPKIIPVDPLKIVSNPTSLCDYRNNLAYIFSLFKLLNIPVLWNIEDWITNYDFDFFLLQLYYLYENLKFEQCTLPPAHENRSGLTSGPNGEALVVGIIYKDSHHNGSFLPSKLLRKAVRLGGQAQTGVNSADIYDSNSSSIRILPIYRNSNLNSRFYANGILPQGMVTFKSSKDYNPSDNNTFIINKELKNFKSVESSNILSILINSSTTNFSATKTKSSAQPSPTQKTNLTSTIIRSNVITPSLVKSTMEWNPRTKTNTSRENNVENSLIFSVLKDHHKRVTHLNSTISPLSSTLNQSGFQNQLEDPSTLVQFDDILMPQELPKDEVELSLKLTKEINTMIQELENEMKVSQKEMNSFEEALTNKYLYLEENSNNFDEFEYENQFLLLEKEREELESEKLRLQDYFERKIELIRLRKEEEQERYNKLKSNNTYANYYSTIGNSSPLQSSNNLSSKVNEFSNSLSKSFAKSKTKSKKSHKILSESEKISAEQGWIGLNSKNNTHNYHLKSRQAVSNLAFQMKITPKNLLLRENQKLVNDSSKQGLNSTINNLTSNNHSPESYFEAGDLLKQTQTPTLNSPSNPHPSLAISGAGGIEGSFVRFQHRLAIASVKWQQNHDPSFEIPPYLSPFFSTNQSNQSNVANLNMSIGINTVKSKSNRLSVQEIIGSGPKSLSVDLIAVPDRTQAKQMLNHSYDNSNKLDDHKQSSPNGLTPSGLPKDLLLAIRQEELALMYAEDARRRLALTEKSLDIMQKQLRFNDDELTVNNYPSSPQSIHHTSFSNININSIQQQNPFQQKENQYKSLTNRQQVQLQTPTNNLTNSRYNSPSRTGFIPTFQYVDFATAMTYLCEEHHCSMEGTSPRDVCLTLVDISDDSMSQNSTQNSFNYALAWKDIINPISSNASLTSLPSNYSGIILLQDLELISLAQQNSNVVFLKLALNDQNTLSRAIKNSKGRAFITLKFPTPNQALDFLIALSSLKYLIFSH